MADISTKYLGLKLQSPVIVGSSGLTSSVENVIEYEKQGAGAVVLKSLFEEQILHEVRHTLGQDSITNQYPEAFDYISNFSRSNNLDKYMALIRDCRKSVGIPVIASINCATDAEWTSYAKKIEDAGANALELNIFVLPSDPANSPEQLEKVYFNILEKVVKQVRIPVALKISSYFSGLASSAQKFAWAGAKGLVLFNRFYSPDIDIEDLEIKATHVLSSPDEIYMPLRWVAILSDKVSCDLAGTTGVHDAAGMIKMMLAGAKAVEIVSTIYKNGPGQIRLMVNELEHWMQEHDYASVNDFIGKMNLRNSSNPVAYERVQFMKHFAGIE
ncbi:MAG TPA: dihydroorotate dehydrogenase-like protein [Bacteroidales bacterium]|jgi:dihydroorotate dehydrogenase (fumarate)|nr:dihydroorotate dehydrogenase-like protein [Bacteroidales bacterium]